MATYLEKLRHFRQAFKQHGGMLGSLKQLYWTEELKVGTYVGADKYGNKYYENNLFFVGRNRWIQYAPQYGMDYDGSQIPSDWHRWLHYSTDSPPSVTPCTQRDWFLDHEENFSGTAKGFVPFSTTRPKVEAWKPPQSKAQ
ncbi:PREDICTED: probable NADH dehydrogenase [ubiquinone] 1 alpha subcomplex subunit 12 isoform X2 [Priapulus caudatus]|uniref:NADH dehydrogenase [ubiquinone] 1 alpha subcomplex subunit 12 n=1 Tax=Priapulus caudatus TaxID=37621 RepID=A0ABM1EWN4_PRICU|nr:PREDICTED: probable NADH dehydrogenase [ubiquinone] 1 alpha subcomplex subunit 12 isoform X2 [Priapulus caudatus]